MRLDLDRKDDSDCCTTQSNQMLQRNAYGLPYPIQLYSPFDDERLAARDPYDVLHSLSERVGLALRFRRVVARERRWNALCVGDAADAEPEGDDGGDVGTHCEVGLVGLWWRLGWFSGVRTGWRSEE